MSGRKRVAVLFGGRSAEHEISVITGLEAVSALRGGAYEPVPIYVDLRGKWFTGDALLKKEFYKQLPSSLSQVREVTLLPTPGIGGLVVREEGRMKRLFSGEEIIPIDVYLPIFHGQYGEDGCLQGLFEMADVAYAGSPLPASAVAMNKHLCKKILGAHGVPTLPGVVVHKEEARQGIAALRARILETPELSTFPLFIKPLNLGSSVGVSRADDAASLDGALAKVFQLDSAALVEPCITDLLEVNISVIEDAEQGTIASVTEVPVPTQGTLTYEDKYMRGGKGKGGGAKRAGNRLEGMAGLTRVVDPEDLDPKYKESVSNYAKDAYGILGCGGVVRFDFMIDTASGKLYFNELNPIPGSLSYYLWEKTNPRLLYPDILDRMIEGAVRRKQLRAGLQRDLGFRAMFS